NIINGKATQGNTKIRPKPALGDHEPLLVHWIEAMSQHEFPITTRNLLVPAGKVAKEMGVDQLFNDEVVAPTMLVFSGKQMPKGIAKTMLSDWSMAVSDKGWITGETFFEYVANVFYPCLMEKKIQLPVILFLDGHPLGIAIFGPLKKEWAKEVHDWLTKEIVQNGFRTTGLFPFDLSVIDYSKCVTKKVENEAELEVEPVTIVKRNEDNIKGHTNLESLIEPNVIAEFKENINEEWNGLEQSKHLFDIWRKSSLQSNILISDTVGISISLLDEVNDRSNYLAINITSNRAPKKRKEILGKKCSLATGGEDVPSPFKRNLLWPKYLQKKKTVRHRLQMPSIVTSRRFQEYEEKKELVKIKVEELKAERKRKREEKKTQKKIGPVQYVSADDEVDFICHLCITDDKDCMSDVEELESEEEESDDS
ncbi:hypothetical protein AGLY_012451, partial [Aphis glycines]